MRELTPADVRLPVDLQLTGYDYLPCYVFSETMFHAGDAIIFENQSIPGTGYTILAPVGGMIMRSEYVNEWVGSYVVIRTDFIATSSRGKTGQVYYYIVHHNGLVSGLSINKRIDIGDPLVEVSTAHGGHGAKMIDFSLFVDNDPYVQSNPEYDDWTGTEFLNTFDYMKDDLSLLPSTAYNLLPICKGNPIPIAKRTPQP